MYNVHFRFVVIVDLIFTLVFAIEMGLKIGALGMVGEGGYIPTQHFGSACLDIRQSPRGPLFMIVTRQVLNKRLEYLGRLCRRNLHRL